MSDEKKIERTGAGTWICKRLKTVAGFVFVVNQADLIDHTHGGICLYDDQTSLNPHREGEQEARARFIVLADHHFDKMEEALKAWQKVESEMRENNPCPDLALRARYRQEAIILSRAVLAAIDAERAKP